MRRLLPPLWDLLLAEGFAVGALIHGGICLMGADHDTVQRAIVLGVAVISALLHSAFNALVGMTIHGVFLLLLNYSVSIRLFQKTIPTVAFWKKM